MNEWMTDVFVEQPLASPGSANYGTIGFWGDQAHILHHIEIMGRKTCKEMTTILGHILQGLTSAIIQLAWCEAGRSRRIPGCLVVNTCFSCPDRREHGGGEAAVAWGAGGLSGGGGGAGGVAGGWEAGGGAGGCGDWLWPCPCTPWSSVAGNEQALWHCFSRAGQICQHHMTFWSFWAKICTILFQIPW